MRLFGRLAPGVREVRADEVQVDDKLAAGRFQELAMGNAKAGELVVEVVTEGGLVYITGDRAPGYSWTLAPEETVMLEREN